MNLFKGASDGAWDPLTRRTLMRRLTHEFHEMKIEMTIKYRVINFLAITVDAWSTKGNKRSFLGSTIHYVSISTAITKKFFNWFFKFRLTKEL